MAVERLAEAFGFEGFKKADKFKAEMTEGLIAGEKVILAKPQTFMNLSGQAVQLLQNYYRLEPTDVLVIYDDVEIPLGSLRIRTGGTSGGHNGISSVLKELATLEVPRIRIGIQPEKPFPGALEDFVLGQLTGPEEKALKTVFEKMPQLTEKLVQGKIDEAMQDYN
jgi:PTH1 family peptidyl-tRNA hydrolase